MGPQFCMKKYQDYIQSNIDGDEKESPVGFGLKRMAIGWAYMVGHLIGSGFVPVDWVMSDNFGELGFIQRGFWFTLWFKVILAKYIAAFLFAEGACIVSGLTCSIVSHCKAKF